MILCLSVYQGLRYLMPVIAIYLLYCYRGARLILTEAFKIKGRNIGISFILFYLFIGYDEYCIAASPDNVVFWTFKKERANIISLDYDVISKESSPKNAIIWDPYSAEDSMAFKYIKENVPDTDIIAFSKPRALALYTNKRCMILGQITSEENKRKLDSMKVRYMLIKNGIDDGPFRKYLTDMHPAMDSVNIAPEYVLYKFK